MAAPRKFIFHIDDKTREQLEQLSALRSAMTGEKSACRHVLIDQIHADWLLAVRKGYIDPKTGAINISTPMIAAKTAVANK